MLILSSITVLSVLRYGHFEYKIRTINIRKTTKIILIYNKLKYLLDNGNVVNKCVLTLNIKIDSKQAVVGIAYTALEKENVGISLRLHN